jgi:nucleoside-triphosphatase
MPPIVVATVGDASVARGGRLAAVALLLLTGVPGVGKTTALRRAAAQLRQRQARGFFTEELRQQGARVGFRLETLDGRRAVLARIGLASAARVGRYGVDLDALDEIVTTTLVPADPAALYLIDEIGKMECLSPCFVEAVEALLDADATLVATVSQKGGGFMADVKRRRGATLWELTRDNRDEIPEQIVAWTAEHS